MTFCSQVLNAYLKEKGISQKELASLLGISPSFITRLLLRGALPSVELARKIVEITKVDSRLFFCEIVNDLVESYRKGCVKKYKRLYQKI